MFLLLFSLLIFWVLLTSCNIIAKFQCSAVQLYIAKTLKQGDKFYSILFFSAFFYELYKGKRII